MLRQLSYPKILHLKDVAELKGKLVYLINSYEENGLAFLLERSDGNLNVTITDWDSNNLIKDDKLDPVAALFMKQEIYHFYHVMKLINLDKAIFYVVRSLDEFILVDIRLSLNKFCSPGFIKDVFGNCCKTQEIFKILDLNDENYKLILNKDKEFNKEFIIKSATFNCFQLNDGLYPLYAKI